MGQKRPGSAGDGIARLVLAAADHQLDVCQNLVVRGACALQDRDHRHAVDAVRVGRAGGEVIKPRPDRGIQRRDGAEASRLDIGITGIVRNAVDHRL